MENRPSIDPYLLKIEGLRPFVDADISIDKVVNRQKIKRAFGVGLLGLALRFGGSAPLAVSAQGPETPTPTPVSSEEPGGEKCRLFVRVWKDVIPPNNSFQSGDEYLSDVNVCLDPGEQNNCKSTNSQGIADFNGIAGGHRNIKIGPFPDGSFIRRAINLIREGFKGCKADEHVPWVPGNTATPTSTATEVPTNTATATNTPTATETITATETVTETVTPTSTGTETPTTTSTPEGDTATPSATPETPGTPVTQTATKTQPPVTKTVTKVATPENTPYYGGVNNTNNDSESDNNGLAGGILAAGAAGAAAGAWYIAEDRKKFQRYLRRKKRKEI